MRLVDRDIRREFYQIQNVVSMPVDFFPWDEVESFAAALQERGFRLLPATAAKAEALEDYQKMRRVTASRSLEEMFILEGRPLPKMRLPRPLWMDASNRTAAGLTEPPAQSTE